MTTPEIRRSHIVQAIGTDGSVSVANLADQLAVSEMTIRRDLDELEKDGLVRRVYGGAVSARSRSYEPPFRVRSTESSAAKRRIGKRAAQLVADGDTVALDVGTTTIEVGQNLVDRKNLTVITTSLRIANFFFSQSNTRLILSGGIVRQEEGSLTGELPKEAFKRLYVDRLFLGVASIHSDVGLTEYNWDDAVVKQAMIESAKEVIVVADSTKFETVAFAHVAPFSSIHKLVTDSFPPDPLATRLAEHNVSVIVAGGGGDGRA